MFTEIWRPIPIPVALIKDRGLPAQARYLFMLMQGRSIAANTALPRAFTPQKLARLSGLAGVKSLRRHLRSLSREGWILVTEQSGPLPDIYEPAASPGHTPTLTVPASLIRHRSLSPSSKVLYAALAAHGQGTKGSKMNQADMAEIAGFGSVNTVRNCIGQLSRAGWLGVSRSGTGRAYIYELLDPHLTWRRHLLGRVRARLRREVHKGEAIMKEMLNVVIADDRFEDNARPGFLVNPMTGERLEFDRWYTGAGLAFEFNGPQHYGQTELYPALERVRKQQARDLIKAAIAYERGISLVLVHPEDLSFRRLTELVRGTGEIPGGVPADGGRRKGRLVAAGGIGTGRIPIRESVDDFKQDPIVKYLSRIGRSYVQRAAGPVGPQSSGIEPTGARPTSTGSVAPRPPDR